MLLLRRLHVLSGLLFPLCALAAPFMAAVGMVGLITQGNTFAIMSVCGKRPVMICSVP